MARALRTQADQRRDINPLDQFGRKWSMTIEIITGDPTGGIFPAGWSDPLKTPMKYIKVRRTPEGQSELGRVLVDFPSWVEEIRHEDGLWYQQLYENAIAKYATIDPAKVATLDRDPFLLRLTGPKPWPSIEVITAAMQGDRGFLGLEPLTPKHRAMLNMSTIEDLKAGATMPEAPVTRDLSTPPESYKEFIRWAYETGAAPPGDLKRVGELWQAHRANLQAA